MSATIPEAFLPPIASPQARDGGEKQRPYLFLFTNDPFLRAVLMEDRGHSEIMRIIDDCELICLGSEPGFDEVARQLAERCDRKDFEQ